MPEILCTPLGLFYVQLECLAEQVTVVLHKLHDYAQSRMSKLNLFMFILTLSNCVLSTLLAYIVSRQKHTNLVACNVCVISYLHPVGTPGYVGARTSNTIFTRDIVEMCGLCATIAT